LLRSDGALKKLADGARQIAQPDAIWKIVDQICFYAPQPNQRPEDIQVCRF
jgi:hypothetical protein